jgi:hypothetical protein
VVVPVEDWLCAASSALMVAGEICEPPLPPPVLVLDEAEELEKASNRLAGLIALACEDDDFEEVSDFRASIADDAAPRASNMRTPPTPRNAAPRSCMFLSKRRAKEMSGQKTQ